MSEIFLSYMHVSFFLHAHIAAATCHPGFHRFMHARYLASCSSRSLLCSCRKYFFLICMFPSFCMHTLLLLRVIPVFIGSCMPVIWRAVAADHCSAHVGNISFLYACFLLFACTHCC